MKYIYLMLFLTTQLLSGQEDFADFDIELKGLTPEGKAFSIVDNENTYLFFENRKEVKAVYLDKNQNLISEYSFTRPKRKFKNVLGYNSSGDDYHIYFSTKKKDEFCIVTVNLKNKTSSIKNVELKLETTFLDAYLKDNIFHIVSLNDESVINIHSFKDDLSFTKNTFDFSNHQFNIDNFSKTKNKLADFYLSPYGFGLIEKLEVIDNKIPNSLEISSITNKIYHVGDEVIFSLDAYEETTLLIRLNINTFQSSVESISHVDIRDEKNDFMKTNSLLFENKLYQISSTKENLSFSYQDLLSNNRSTIIRLNGKEDVSFKNTPIIQDGGYYSTRRELLKTKQYLRKVFDANPGISINKSNSQYQVRLGASKELMHSSGSGMSGAIGGGTVTGFSPVRGVSFGYFISPTINSYGSFITTKSTYIKSLFDVNLNHQKGKVSNTEFDLISTFEKEYNNELRFKTIFRYNDTYILGFYLKGKYYLKSFKK